MKASRLLSILMLLQSHPRMTAAALAQALEVSSRTILRDIDQLSAAGVPVWAERGREGGFCLRPGWSTQLTGMTEPEAHALLLAGLPAAAAELGLGGAALSARLKLVGSLPAPLREQAARVAERLHIDPVDWYRAPDTPTQLREVAEAVWHNRRLRVRYTSWRRTTWREWEPLGLVLKAGAWYLAAREAGDTAVRTYRLASVQALAPGRGSFRRPRGFDLAAYWREAAVRFEAKLRPLHAQLWVSPRAWGWLVHGRQEVVALPPGEIVPAGPADWRAVRLAVESVEQGARQVLGYGDEVEVVAPLALRRRVAELADRVRQRHAV
ncbi:helix-turn-helix transcriptional regulator [Ideonella sp.]|uniref:helix-turn-helix transcriptional regulator n=1 Tax=Ideonella sp. TaxID=1929293 RepID=UPI0035AEEF27